MSSNMDEWGEAKRWTRKVFGLGVVVWLTIFVLVAAIGIGSWAASVAFSPVKGAGEAFKQKQSAVNRIQKQEMFEQLTADIDGYVAKISVARAAVTSATSEIDRGLRQTELIGITQTCIDAVQQYNAESRKYTSRDFKSAGLPYKRSPAKCEGGKS